MTINDEVRLVLEILAGVIEKENHCAFCAAHDDHLVCESSPALDRVASKLREIAHRGIVE